MVGAPFARLIANVIVMGGGVLGRAFLDAYKQALSKRLLQPGLRHPCHTYVLTSITVPSSRLRERSRQWRGICSSKCSQGWQAVRSRRLAGERGACSASTTRCGQCCATPHERQLFVAFSRYPGAHDPQRKTDGDGGRGARGTQAADRDERSEHRWLQVFATESIERMRCARGQRRIKLELSRCGR